MTPDLQRARSAIASEIGPDVAEFTPAGEKHFVGEAALLAMGGTFLYAFFKGFVQKAGEAAGKEIGEPAGSAGATAFACGAADLGEGIALGEAVTAEIINS